MKPKTIMLIAGEASGDILAAELVKALRSTLAAAYALPSDDVQPLHTSLEPRFFGAGGPQMAQAGVELALDLTAHSVVGLSDVLLNLLKFRRIFNQLLELAIDQQPDAIICIDNSGFNLRFAEAVRKYVRHEQGTFANWNPLIIQYVSPQVWASRAGRAAKLERCVDLLLTIFPFEKGWYAQRVPRLKVEFVGHPVVDRYAALPRPVISENANPKPLVLLLPGSRPAELHRHLPVMAQAFQQMARARSLRNLVILPNERLLKIAQGCAGSSTALNFQIGGLAQGLQEADLALASTGTVTMECAWFGVPTVALYKTSWSTYHIAKRLIQVRFLAMPNILANEAVFPEFIQGEATPEHLARAGLELLSNSALRLQTKRKLEQISLSLGPPGAAARAADAITRLFCATENANIKATLEAASAQASETGGAR